MVKTVPQFIITPQLYYILSLFKGNKMAKPTFQHNPRVAQIFEDLEKYLEFCQDFGYKFDEAELYNPRSYSYRQFGKHIVGKHAKDQWAENSK
jgi:hypothetical protein